MINLAAAIQLAQLGTIVVGFLGVVVTLRSHRRQMHAQLFLEFSSRFHDVLGCMPVEVWKSGGSDTALEHSALLTRSCLQCFHIVANLFHLHKAGYVSQDLWRPWQRGLRRMMEGPVLQREWLALEPAFGHLPEFCRYIRGMMGEKSHGRCAHCRQVVVHPCQE